jgi:hypothetical protein
MSRHVLRICSGNLTASPLIRDGNAQGPSVISRTAVISSLSCSEEMDLYILHMSAFYLTHV